MVLILSVTLTHPKTSIYPEVHSRIFFSMLPSTHKIVCSKFTNNFYNNRGFSGYLFRQEPSSTNGLIHSAQEFNVK